MPKKIKLFWWSERKLMSKPKENYGDLLGKYIVEKLSGKKVVWVQPKKQRLKTIFSPVYVTIGSILAQVNKRCIVWGSGIISRDQHVENAKFLAVRGPKTRQRLLDLGYDVPEIYGDPGLLLPKFYNPKIEKKYKIGIIPHYSDYELIINQFQNNNNVSVIDLMTNDIENTTNQILECENIVSSSLHGLIISHAYQIPAVWVKFSNNLFGDDVKFEDYFTSVELSYQAQTVQDLNFTRDIDNLSGQQFSKPKKEVIERLQNGLLESNPFVKN